MNDNQNTKTIKLNKEQTMSFYRAKENELNSISQKLQEIDNLFLEISKAEGTLNEIRKIKKSGKMLMNIGAGVLVDCSVENITEVKISLPGSIMISKNIDDVINDIANRKKELTDIKQKLSANYNNTVRTLQEISKAMEVMQKNNLKESNNVS